MLQDAHDYLVRRASRTRLVTPYWGCITKRSGNLIGQDVDLRSRANDPTGALIGKDAESFREVVNMTATAQRLIDALSWVMSQGRFSDCSICTDPTTSNFYSDLLLLGGNGVPVARFEVTDKDARKSSIKVKVADSIKKLNNAALDDATRGGITARFVVGSHEMRSRIRLFSVCVWEIGNATFPTIIGEVR